MQHLISSRLAYAAELASNEEHHGGPMVIRTTRKRRVAEHGMPAWVRLQGLIFVHLEWDLLRTEPLGSAESQ